MFKKNKKQKVFKKKSEPKDLLNYLETEKLEECLLHDMAKQESVENIGYLLDHISPDEEEIDLKEKKQLLEEQKESFDLSDDIEGELSLDVYEDGDSLVVEAPIAGVELKDIDINFNQGVLTITGLRHAEKKVAEEKYFTHECYWGKFSRSILLPLDVNTSSIKAFLKNGVLKIVLPKLELPANVDIKVRKNK